jgi:RNA polymerase sigma factor (sigma-70 family)
MDEKKIISRCLMGEGKAFEMIVNKYQSQLLRFTWSILGDKDEAKDVTQDSFVRSYLHLRSFDPKKCFKTWLFTIAYNRSMDKIRENKSRNRLIDKLKKDDSSVPKNENPEKRLEDSEQFHLILRMLNEKERTALSLKLNEGYLAREIAGVLGCKESTVRVLILNAKRKLKKILEKKYHV